MSTKLYSYLNGEYILAEDARISPLDRGIVFGDGVYEVIPVFEGKLLFLDEHLDRLNNSLSGIWMQPPHTHNEWRTILKTLVDKNGKGNQYIYLQVTRGVQMVRDHQIPKHITPTLFAISYPKALSSKEELKKGIKVITVSDIRWKHCDIKTTARLAYVLMYQEAKDAGVDEAIIINDSYAIEGSSSNLFIVREGVIITPPKSSLLLSGITRDKILEIAHRHKIPHREEVIAEKELLKADELWITSSTRGVHPVVELNGQPIGNGRVGPLWEKMWGYYGEEITRVPD